MEQVDIASIANSHDVNHFIIFLENHDGMTYNSLMRELSRLYCEMTPQDTVMECRFVSMAVSMSSTFVDFWFESFRRTYSTNRIFFCKNKTEIISYVASEIALGAFKEFKIGNLY